MDFSVSVEGGGDHFIFKVWFHQPRNPNSLIVKYCEVRSRAFALQQTALKRTPVQTEWCSEIPVAASVESHGPPPSGRRQCAPTGMLAPSTILLTVCCSGAFSSFLSHPRDSMFCGHLYSSLPAVSSHLCVKLTCIFGNSRSQHWLKWWVVVRLTFPWHFATAGRHFWYSLWNSFICLQHYSLTL